MRPELRGREPAERRFVGMRIKRAGRSVITLIGLVLAVSAAGCNELELASSWRDRDIVIDGDARDWRGLTTYVEEGNIAVGVANDGEDMFVCLHSPTREVAGQIVIHGMTVWFDPEGGGARELGFHCPMGTGEMPKPGSMDMERGEMKDLIAEMVEVAAREVEILGPDGLVYGNFSTAEIDGLEIALGYTDGRIVYELRLPLEKTEARPYALGASWEKNVSISFVTPEVDMEAMRESMRESMGDRPPPGGGPGGGRGGGGGPGGGMPGGMSPGGAPQAVELRCKVALASGASLEQLPE